MTRVEKSVLVMHSAREMWDLVVNIPAYPEFLPWCSGAEVHQNDGAEMIATLHINFHGLRQQFTSRNTSVVAQSLVMDLVEGPFRHLRGEFHFTALQPDACKIAFSLEWTFSNGVLEKAVGPVFHAIANTMVEAFVTRAATLYGEVPRCK